MYNNSDKPYGDAPRSPSPAKPTRGSLVDLESMKSDDDESDTATDTYRVALDAVRDAAARLAAAMEKGEPSVLTDAYDIAHRAVYETFSAAILTAANNRGRLAAASAIQRSSVPEQANVAPDAPCDDPGARHASLARVARDDAYDRAKRAVGFSIRGALFVAAAGELYPPAHASEGASAHVNAVLMSNEAEEKAASDAASAAANAYAAACFARAARDAGSPDADEAATAALDAARHALVAFEAVLLKSAISGKSVMDMIRLLSEPADDERESGH